MHSGTINSVEEVFSVLNVVKFRMISDGKRETQMGLWNLEWILISIHSIEGMF